MFFLEKLKESVSILFEDFLDLINRLRKIVDKYKSDLEKSEALTRYCLVDPFLKVWGWDVNDPSLVRPEFSTEAGRPDYALLTEGKPLIYVGVKALGRQEKIEQYINYCITTGVPYFVTTDGARWELYDTHLPKPIQEKKIAEWDILKDEPYKIIQKAFVIWRLNRELAQPPQPLIAKHVSESFMETTITRGTPISRLRIKLGQAIPYRKIIFPDGREYEIKKWRDLLINIVSWLIETGRIRREDTPLSSPKSRKRYILNTEPKHRDGASYKYPKKIGPYFLELHLGSRTIVRWSVYLLKKYNIDTSRVILE